MQSSDQNKVHDERYGPLRAPTHVQEWERNIEPVSKVLLSETIGRRLRDYQELSQCELFGAVSRCFMLLWVMDKNCDIWLAFEEIIAPPGAHNLTGHPRRRGYPTHPAEEKKLGHPTLISCGEARAAGELYLDQEDDSTELFWHVNVGSGRYCLDSPPTQEQCEAIHERFRVIVGESILWDEL